MRGRGLIKHRYSGKGGIHHSHSPERCRHSYERNMTWSVSQTSGIDIFVSFIFCVRKAAVLDLTQHRSKDCGVVVVEPQGKRTLPDHSPPQASRVRWVPLIGVSAGRAD